jgi:methylenetetrahydrofolate reductase (NADPH)
LIAGLGPSLADPERKIAGFHIFTFNDLADTEAWRRQRLSELAPAAVPTKEKGP